MKLKSYQILSLSLVMIFLGSCSKDHGFTIDGRNNADVTIINETTGETWHGDSEGINQSVGISFGGSEDETTFDIVAHEGNVLQVKYSPYSHFAEEHSVIMTSYFHGVDTTIVEHAPYEVKFTINSSVSKDIHNLVVVGTSRKPSDECYLNESRVVRIKVE